jgi:hypothetical protein
MATSATSSGRELIDRLVADMARRGLQPDAKETELLAIAERLANQLQGLERSIRRNGYSSKLESGRIVANPCIAQLNSTSTALAKVLQQIQMYEVPAINRVRQRAAQTRWQAHNTAKAKLAAGE